MRISRYKRVKRKVIGKMNSDKYQMIFPRRRQSARNRNYNNRWKKEHQCVKAKVR